MSYDYKDIVVYLLDWFELNARILPWRSEPKPYYVWISEIMLQQTRVEAVKPYFDRFIEKLPDCASLAEVEDEVLMKLWEGLGYYSRAGNLKKAASIIMEQYDGVIPLDYDSLLKLPGIGSYTAGAIASIAFSQPVPAVDGNVLRVMKRIAGSFDDISKETVKQELARDIVRVLPPGQSGTFNQALMELGALVCLPNGKPLCEQCPVMHLCKAFHEGTIDKIPVKPEKKKRTIEERTVFLLECQGKFAIRKRENRGLLAGLWELPNTLGQVSVEEIKTKFGTVEVEKLTKAKHIFTHIEWRMSGYLVHLSRMPEEYTWCSVEEIVGEYCLPNVFSYYKKLLVERKEA